jgi:hypothetical protein
VYVSGGERFTLNFGSGPRASVPSNAHTSQEIAPLYFIASVRNTRIEKLREKGCGPLLALFDSWAKRGRIIMKTMISLVWRVQSNLAENCAVIMEEIYICVSAATLLQRANNACKLIKVMCVVWVLILLFIAAE